ncbi:MAG: hypothetical protein ABR915_04240 [Thermoguttaceae bacterium]
MISGLRQRFLGLCLPPLVFCALDATVTLMGQSTEYWQNQWADVNEIAPTFHYLLTVHPAAFAVGMAGWAVIFVMVLFLLPDTLALIVSVAIVLGHAGGTVAWLGYHFKFSYQMCNGLALLAAVAIGTGVRWGWQATPNEALRLDRMPQVWRWTLILLLGGIGVYLFLWPRSIAS